MRISKWTLWQIIVFIIAILIEIKIRVLNPWKSVFTGWTVRLGGNDPWYYYRLIENCIHNFPNRIWFDPFTYYPYGSYVHFGPFLVYLSSIAGLLFGAKSGVALRSVISFVPVLGGIAALFPVYLVAKEVYNERVAIMSVFLLSFIPGQFLARSILGFNDHHIWEVVWMTATLGFFFYAINNWSGEKLLDKRNILLSILIGIPLGMYLDTWPPGFIIAVIIVIGLYIGLILSDYIDFHSWYLPLTALGFFVAALLYLPFAFCYPGMSIVLYSKLQLMILLALVALLLVIWAIDINYDIIKSAIKINKSIFFALLFVISFGVTPILFPKLHHYVMEIIGVIHPKGGALTVAEMYPFFFTQSGQFTLSNAYLNFGLAFFFAFPAMVYSIYRIYKNRKFTELQLFIWAVIMFVALWGQNRFAYYFAAVTAIYCALALELLFNKLHLYALIENLLGEKTKYSITRVALAIVLAIIVIAPTVSLANLESGSTGGPPKQWYDALVWLRNNTPEKKLYDQYYYQLYPVPPNNTHPYKYPFKTYGIMSWWDYGHWIESIAHRMPIANPFQAGIGNKYNNIPGAAPFFTALNESYADSIAKKLNVKYVISDIEMATGKFYAMAAWAEGNLTAVGKYYGGYLYIAPGGVLGIASNPWQIPPNSIVLMRLFSKLYYETMEARLHIFDGCGLSHYRMIYESQPSGLWYRYLQWTGGKTNSSRILSIAVTDAYQHVIHGFSPSFTAQEILIKYAYMKLYQKQLGLPAPKLQATGFVKIFEWVKGAKIEGKVPPNVKYVKISTKIKTNIGRTFEYVKIAKVVNGTYSAIVPYAQNTHYPVKPITPYFIQAGKVIKTVNITESQVLNGGTVVVNFT